MDLEPIKKIKFKSKEDNSKVYLVGPPDSLITIQM